MDRPGRHGVHALALWAVLVLGVWAAVQAGDSGGAAGRAGPAAVATNREPAADPAVLPGRAAVELRVVAHVGSLRIVMAAILAGLAGIPAALRRRTGPGAADRPVHVGRRRAVSLRAPPVPLAT